MSNTHHNHRTGSTVISNTGSERATGGSGNKIVTCDGKSHIVWQDISRDGYLNRVRSLDHVAGELTDTVILNTGVDNHARPVITIDHDGFLHTLMSGHGSPISYRKSEKPNDASSWSEAETAGAGTYPIIICAENGTLFFTVRAEAADGVDLYAKPRDATWRRQAKLVSRSAEYRSGYAAFHNHICTGPDGTLHFVCTFYEGFGRTEKRGLHQAVCYMRSPDRGNTWQKSDGTPVKIPASPEKMDIIARSVEERHEPMPPPEVTCGGIAVTSDNRVRIMCLSHRKRPGEIVLYEIEPEGRWRQLSIDALDETYPEMRSRACSFAMREDDSICALATLTPLSHGWDRGKPLRGAAEDDKPDRCAAWLLSGSFDGTFHVVPEIEAGTPFNSPAFERPTGVNVIPAGCLPSYAYFDGTSRYPGGLEAYFADIEGYVKHGDLITNTVYWVFSQTIA